MTNQIWSTRFKQNEGGFSLIEIMVAMAISLIVIGATYTAFVYQNNSYVTQERVAMMQQNLRAGLNMMAREIRGSGYAFADDTVNSGIITPGASSLTFTRDDDDPNATSFDTIAYSYDSTSQTLDRNFNGGGSEPVSENIEALGFAYAFDADDDGELDRSANGNVIWAVDSGGDNDWDNLDVNDDGVIDINDTPSGATANTETILGTDTGILVSVDDIRAVKVWILARTSSQDRKFTNTRTYVTGNQKATYNDGFRRRLLTTAIKCRNLELK